MNPEVVILSGVRTAIIDFGGALKNIPPARLGEIVIREAIARAGIVADDVQHVVVGQMLSTIPQDAYLARFAPPKAGVPVGVPALTSNRLCGSSVQAI